jgi:hypothetical protein
MLPLYSSDGHVVTLIERGGPALHEYFPQCLCGWKGIGILDSWPLLTQYETVQTLLKTFSMAEVLAYYGLMMGNRNVALRQILDHLAITIEKSDSITEDILQRTIWKEAIGQSEEFQEGFEKRIKIILEGAAQVKKILTEIPSPALPEVPEEVKQILDALTPHLNSPIVENLRKTL